MRIIAGDIGGTKTLLQLVDASAATHTVISEHRYPSGDYATFDAMLRDFVKGDGAPIDAACFAVAGPVFENRAEVTNLHWLIETAELERDFSIPRVALINDFFAVALGVPLLGPDDRLVLHEGVREPHAPIAILGAGTGLGQAILVWNDQWRVIPSEGGHADFGPQDEEQCGLLLSLIKRYGHASWERVCSGMGLVNIYEYLGGKDADPARIAELCDEGDDLAKRTFAIFVDIYGAEAGNMALRILSRGGVYLAGGIAAKNSKHFTDGKFMTAFLRKGRFRELLEAMPVEVITNEKVGLLGAVEMARRVATT